MIDYASIGYKIKQIRQGKGVTQEQLAEAAGVGVTHISHLETGSGTVSLKVFLAIVNYLDCSADDILCKEIPMARCGMIGIESRIRCHDPSDHRSRRLGMRLFHRCFGKLFGALDCVRNVTDLRISSVRGVLIANLLDHIEPGILIVSEALCTDFGGNDHLLSVRIGYLHSDMRAHHVGRIFALIFPQISFSKRQKTLAAFDAVIHKHARIRKAIRRMLESDKSHTVLIIALYALFAVLVLVKRLPKLTAFKNTARCGDGFIIRNEDQLRTARAAF